MTKQPTETQEQMKLANVLRMLDLCFFHAPSEGTRKVQFITKLNAMGFSSGFPDIIIFDIPPDYPGSQGAAIELKRSKGGVASESQMEWLSKLGNRGWLVAVCNGADEAIDRLKDWGYIK